MRISTRVLIALAISATPALATTTFLTDTTGTGTLGWTSESSSAVLTGYGTTPKVNADYQGGGIVIDGAAYSKGLGAAEQSDITYTLGGNYNYFTGIVGLQDAPLTDTIKGSVRFQLWSGSADTLQLDPTTHLPIYGANGLPQYTHNGGTLLWDSGIMGNGQVTGRLSVQVPVTGVQTLTLHTDPVPWANGYTYDINNGPGSSYYPGNSQYWLYGGDQANWGNAAVVTGTPTPVVVPAHSTGYTVPSLGVGTAPGANLQKTMAKLATSTPANKKTVNILLYGQSITRQDWWDDMAGKLQRQYPNAIINIENHSWSGAFADILSQSSFSGQDIYVTDKTTGTKVAPDLVIMHDYEGSKVGPPNYDPNNPYPYYRQILTNIRLAAPNSEMLLINDHYNGYDINLAAPFPADQATWCTSQLPAMASQFNAGVVDMYDIFKNYYAVPGNNLDGKYDYLTSDGEHLSQPGSALYAQVVESYLVYNSVPEPSTLTILALGTAALLRRRRSSGAAKV